MRYTESHEWIEENVNPKKVGITPYAQKELGDIVYVELPKIGAEVKKGQEVVVLESTKAAADVYAPCNGKIISVNEKIKEDPSLINNDPQGQGWLYQIEADDKELSTLMTEEKYQSMVG